MTDQHGPTTSLSSTDLVASIPSTLLDWHDFIRRRPTSFIYKWQRGYRMGGRELKVFPLFIAANGLSEARLGYQRVVFHS